jgi:small subunit ribosomal protein S16
MGSPAGRNNEMVKIRLMRRGATKRPFYRVVVADSRSPRDGRFIENIGKYHPLEDPSLIEIDADRALHWLSKGAQPSEQVENLLKKQGIWERFEATKTPRTAKRTTAARSKKGAATKASATQAEPAPAGAETGPAGESAEPEAAPSSETPKPKRRRRAAAETT